ncbi:hypothetical protein C4D60_Mb11t02450 [Musa balbisiana]|uniref:Uncharacterized protein n=1 Tax=Musa balbisiana TaxID=52838 RepID=A0A4S8J162_MUSBA|nr:hypothetical protein C4D60_Mb11t02450 [Musa balbisiana]
MILVAIVAEMLEEYTALVARVLEHLLRDAPFPRRMRFLMLRSLPFAFPPVPLPAARTRMFYSYHHGSNVIYITIVG